MSNPLPSQLALTSIADGSAQDAAPLRNNYSDIQTAVNALIVALGGGTAGALLYATDASDVAYLPDVPTDGQALIWNAASSRWKPGSVAATSYRKTTSKAVNTSIAATDLLNGEITLAAGVLGTTKALRATLWGDWLQNAGATSKIPQFQLVVGGTTVLDTGAPTITWTVGTGRNAWGATITALETGATNSQVWQIDLWIVKGTSSGQSSGSAENLFATGQGVVTIINTGTQGPMTAKGNNTSALDMSTSKTFAFNVINGVSNASYETRLLGALVEVL